MLQLQGLKLNGRAHVLHAEGFRINPQNQRFLCTRPGKDHLEQEIEDQKTQQKAK